MKATAAVIATLMLVAGLAAAQEQKPSSQPPSSAANAHQSPARETYRLDYTITEMDDGKKVNARTYSVMCEDEGAQTRGSLKVGSRVPVTTGSPSPGGGLATFTYLDLGMNIEARITNTADGSLSLQSEVEMSSIAEGTVANQANAPVIRQLKSSTNNSITVGKPVVISVADDVTSHRQFQIQVVATKFK
jgi:hypothetical protein